MWFLWDSVSCAKGEHNSRLTFPKCSPRNLGSHTTCLPKIWRSRTSGETCVLPSPGALWFPWPWLWLKRAAVYDLYVCAWVFACMYVRACMCVHVNVHMHAHVCMHMYICACVCVHVHACVCMCVCNCKCVCELNICNILFYYCFCNF